MNKTARNERLKLTATWLNGTSIAAVAVGGFAPTTALLLSAAPPGSTTLVVLTTTAWFSIGVALHLTARAILKGIEE